MGDARGTKFVEVGDRCYVARYAEWNVSIGVIRGSQGVAVVDTRATAEQGRQLLDDVRQLTGDANVRWAINTHVHFDHTFGNVAMAGASIHAHENVGKHLASSAERIREIISADPKPDPAYPAITAEVLSDVMSTELRAPDVEFASVTTIDLGDRLVELMHPGRGHTDSDIAVRVPDADVVFGGDLIEEAGPPSFGEDSFPMEWAQTLDLVIGLLTDRTVVVPGHGATVDKAFVQDQRGDVADVSSLIRSLHSQAIPVHNAAEAGAGSWPYPVGHLMTAIRLGYAALDGAASPRTGPPSPAQPPSGTATLPLANT
jgi:glyoxylase-like metal-dependent hydrolase (beta-lactamase superfamily II)